MPLHDVSTPGSPPGTELDYVQITADVSVTGSIGSPTSVIDGNPIFLDGAMAIYVEFFTCAFSSGSQAAIIELYDGGTSLARMCQFNPNTTVSTLVKKRVTPSVGSHTFHIKAWINGGTAGNVSAVAGTYVPAFYRVTVA